MNLEMDILVQDGIVPYEKAKLYAEKISNTANFRTKQIMEDLLYERLLDEMHDPDAVATLINNVMNEQLNNRGLQTVFVDQNGINYNSINGLNSSNQAYDLSYVVSMIDEMPSELRSSIKNINFYDCPNPADKYWFVKYNKADLSNGYFRSAATGGDGTINLWASDQKIDSVLWHEAGHCLDPVVVVNGGYYHRFSDSQEYIAAMQADYQLTQQMSITSYGENARCEDFADAVSIYFGTRPDIIIDNFPNRKAYLDKLFGNDTSTIILDNSIVSGFNSPSSGAGFDSPSSPISSVRDLVSFEYSDEISDAVSEFRNINKQFITEELKKDSAKQIFKDMLGMTSEKAENRLWSEGFITTDETGQILNFNDAKFANYVSEKTGMSYEMVHDMLKVDETVSNTIIDDLTVSAESRILDDLTLGVKDVERYFSLIKNYRSKDYIRELINYPYLDFDALKTSQFYIDYTENILGKDFVDKRMNTFFKGKKETNVFCVQNKKGVDFTLGRGIFGRNEGVNVFSEDDMLKIINKSTKNGEVLTMDDMYDFFNGKKTYDLDYTSLTESLDLPNNYFEDGGCIVKSTVNVNDVRVTLFIDDATNCRFLPGMHTAHIGELMARQKTSLAFTNLSGTNVYMDSKNRISIIKLDKIKERKI